MIQHSRQLSETGRAPATEYATRLEQRQELATGLQRRSLLLSYLRLLWALLLIGMLWYVFGRHTLRWPWLLLPVVAFGVTARRHTEVIAAALRAKRAIAWYKHGLARIEDCWSGLQPRRTPEAAGESLYAADLDLFGAGSLFELLCTTGTSLGEGSLADWLLHPASLAEVLARQDAVRELRDRLDLRETMASVGGPSSFPLDAEALALWGTRITAPIPSFFRWLGPLLAMLTVVAAIWWITGHSAALFSAALLANGTITFLLQARIRPLFTSAEQASQPLHLLAELFAALERENFQTLPCSRCKVSYRQKGCRAPVPCAVWHGSPAPWNNGPISSLNCWISSACIPYSWP